VIGAGGTIAGLLGEGRIRCVCGRLGDEAVLEILRTADIIITTVDEPGVRVAGAVIASRYHLAQIDARGGTIETERRGVVEGDDVEVFIPGSQFGCIMCHEKDYDWEEAVSLAGLSGEADRERRRGLDWRNRGRVGANVDVLYPVLGEARQALWNIIRGRLTESMWLHYEKDENCRPRWTDISDEGLGGCRTCVGQAGLGDVLD